MIETDSGQASNWKKIKTKIVYLTVLLKTPSLNNSNNQIKSKYRMISRNVDFQSSMNKNNSVAAKIEINSVKASSKIVIRQGWSDNLVISVFQFPDFCFKAR